MGEGEFWLAILTFSGSFFGAALTVCGAIYISRRERREKLIEIRQAVINDVDSEIDINIYNVKKIINITLHDGMVFNNEEETCEYCHNIIGYLENLEIKLQELIKPVKSISKNSKEITDDFLNLVSPIEERRIKFQNMTSIYKNHFVKKKNMHRVTDSHDKQKSKEVKNSLLFSKKNVDKDLKRYIKELEEFRQKYLKVN